MLKSNITSKLVRFDVFFIDIEVLKCEAPLITIDVLHDPIEIYFVGNTQPMLNSPVVRSYNFKKANFDGINMQLAAYDWNLILHNSPCIDSAVDTFYDILYDCFNEYIPIKRHSGNSHPPWYNKQILMLKNRKSKLHHKFKLTKTLQDYNLYSATRKKLNEAPNLAFNLNTRTTETNLRNDPKKFWSYVNLKKKTSGFPSVMYRGLTKSSKTGEICELFADFFSQNYTIENPHQTFVATNVNEMINIGSMANQRWKFMST